MKTVIIILLTWCPNVYNWHLCNDKGKFHTYVGANWMCDQGTVDIALARTVWMVPAETFPSCLTGPIVGPMSDDCSVWDFNGDGQVDMRDIAGHWSG